MNTNSSSPYYFSRIGGLDQIRIDTKEDLELLLNLDPKLWVALSLPIHNIDFDEKTLQLIDTNNDGKIRVEELKTAIKFILDNQTDFDAFFKESDVTPLDSFKKESELSKVVSDIILNYGNPNEKTISEEQFTTIFKNFSKQTFNGDGVITDTALIDFPKLKAFFDDIILAYGGEKDLSGENGISNALIEKFLSDAKTQLEWEDSIIETKDTIFTLGEKTSSAFEHFYTIQSKIDDYFSRIELASFDPTFLQKLNPGDKEIQISADELINPIIIDKYPLKKILPNNDDAGVLNLQNNINPAWINKTTDFITYVLWEIFPEKKSSSSANLNRKEWAIIKERFTAYQAWKNTNPNLPIQKIDSNRLREILKENFIADFAPIFEKDKKEESVYKNLTDIQRVILYNKNLRHLLQNFISFNEFYNRDKKTIFLAGKLYLDQRSCTLCIKVDNPNEHSTLAIKSNCCLVYCECKRPETNEKINIVAIFGDGDSDFLYAKKNGIFYDKKGNEWDATIIKIVEQPISIRQAFFAPYKKAVKFIETQIHNFASTMDAKSNKILTTTSTNIATVTTPVPSAKPTSTPFDIAKFVGIFAAIGLALGAIGGAIASITAGFMALTPLKMVIAIAMAILLIIVLISGPSMLMTAIKLHRRSLGPILDANGWAINGNIKINIPLGKAFTKMPEKPKNSKTKIIKTYNDSSASKWIFKFLLSIIIILGVGIGIYYWQYKKCDTSTSQKSTPAVTEAQTIKKDSMTTTVEKDRINTENKSKTSSQK